MLRFDYLSFHFRFIECSKYVKSNYIYYEYFLPGERCYLVFSFLTSFPVSLSSISLKNFIFFFLQGFFFTISFKLQYSNLSSFNVLLSFNTFYYFINSFSICNDNFINNYNFINRNNNSSGRINGKVNLSLLWKKTLCG